MSRNPSHHLHHANLLVGTPDEARLYLESLCEGLDIKIKNNPDFIVFPSETFGIEEARELSLLSTRKALGACKFFLIIPNYLTLEAQNALLKTFEDPSPDTYFFLVLREPGLILATLRSRMQVLTLCGGNASAGEAEKFMDLSIKDRLLYAKKFVDDEKDLPVFLDELLLLSRDRKVYDIITSIRGFYTSPRLVLEHLAVVL